MSNKSNFSKFMLLWTGELISSIGGGLTSFGLGVNVFNKTGSAASMALVTLLGFLPTMLLSVPAGVLADRHDRRLLMMIGDGFSALGILYILICMIQGEAALWQICVGVFISSSFSALLEPSYRATVTDLLTKEEYSKASGMVSLAGSARYLVSPVLAGTLLTVSDIKLLLIIDICTFFPTVITAAFIKNKIAAKETEKNVSFADSLKSGGKALAAKKGVLVLTVVSSFITCFMGVFQILAQPLILDFADSATLGTAETICASGMLVSGLILGAVGIKKGYVKVLSVSLFISGIGMLGFGVCENIYFICPFGFLFFAMLPFANSCLDYLVRTNIPNELQGRAWGLIGFISQLGYAAAYAVSGEVADAISAFMGISVGRGAAWVIMVSGVLLCSSAVLLYSLKSVKSLEDTFYDKKADT